MLILSIIYELHFCLEITGAGTALQEQNECNFNLPLGNIDDNNDVGGSVRLEFDNTEITASAAITVDFTSIVYTGYANSSGSFVGAVRTTLPNYTS